MLADRRLRGRARNREDRILPRPVQEVPAGALAELERLAAFIEGELQVVHLTCAARAAASGERAATLPQVAVNHAAHHLLIDPSLVLFISLRVGEHAGDSKALGKYLGATAVRHRR